MLAEKYKVAADVWSMTSYTEVRRDALAVERWNRLHPADARRRSYLEEQLGETGGPVIAASDYMKSMPDGLAPWLGARLVSLGTDGFGRSDNREHLRRHFEVSAEAIVGATLAKLAQDRTMAAADAARALKELGLDVEAIDPATA